MSNTNNKPYRVHLGYTRTGKDRWRYCDSLQDAQIYLDAAFQNTRTVLTVEHNPKYKGQR